MILINRLSKIVRKEKDSRAEEDQMKFRITDYDTASERSQSKLPIGCTGQCLSLTKQTDFCGLEKKKELVVLCDKSNKYEVRLIPGVLMWLWVVF